jgi:hypothetical protein
MTWSGKHLQAPRHSPARPVNSPAGRISNKTGTIGTRIFQVYA